VASSTSSTVNALGRALFSPALNGPAVNTAPNLAYFTFIGGQ
jgi:hypothetical protein